MASDLNKSSGLLNRFRKSLKFFKIFVLILDSINLIESSASYKLYKTIFIIIHELETDRTVLNSG